MPAAPLRPRIGGALGLLLALVTCAAPQASAPAPARSTSPPRSSPPPIPPPAPAPTPRDPAVAPGSDAWTRLSAATANPLRWAHLRAADSPTLVLGERALFVAPDGALVLVDARTGARRWQTAPTDALRWHSLAATSTAALALGVGADEAAWARSIDLATGAVVDRRAPAGHRRALALGEALATVGACALELLGPDGAPLLTVRGRALDALCLHSPQIVAADATTAALVHWRDGAARLDRVDLRSAALLDTRSLGPDLDIHLDPHTGLVLAATPTGSVRAIRLGDAGPVSRTFASRTGGPVALRGARLVDGRALLLARDGRRWTAVDPTTLTDLWSRDSDALVVLRGERWLASWEPAGAALPRAGALEWLDPQSGAPVARRRLASVDHLALHDAQLLVLGSAGTLAHDLRGAIRWAIPARLRGLVDGQLVLTHLGRRPPGTDVLDPTAGLHRLHLELAATVLARISRDDGDLSLVVLDPPSSPPAPDAPAAPVAPPVLAAFADSDATTTRLPTDPIAAFTDPTCSAPRLTDTSTARAHLACHPLALPDLVFAARSHALPASAGPHLDRIARRWRTGALAEPSQTQFWPTLVVLGRRAASDPPELAAQRAGAVRDALVARGVPCESIAAAADDTPGSRTAILLVPAFGCIL